MNIRDATSYSLTLADLEEDTTYNITVQATTSDNGMSTNGKKIPVRTYTDSKLYIASCQRISYYHPTVPNSSPQNITVESLDPASLIVSWQLPHQRDRNGVIIGYAVQFTRIGSSSVMIVNVTNGTTHTLSGLVAYVNYSVIVAAMTVNGTGPFSDPPVVGRSGEDSKLK